MKNLYSLSPLSPSSMDKRGKDSEKLSNLPKDTANVVEGGFIWLREES